MANRVRRDPVGQGRETNERLALLERRVGSLVIPTIPDEYVLPDRLGPSGQSTADWNTALDPGFYFSAADATNAPAGVTGTLVGFVRRGVGGLVVQEISASGATGTNPARFTWRRQRDASGTWGTWYAFTGEVLASQITGVLDDDLIPTLDLGTKTSGILPAERVGGVAWVDISGKVSASTTQQGIVELATSPETVTGTDTTRAVTPAGLKAAVENAPGAPTDLHGVGGDGSWPPNWLPQTTSIYGWTAPATGATVEHYELWGIPTGGSTAFLLGATKGTEINLYSPFNLPEMSFMVRAVSVSGVPGPFSNSITVEAFDFDISATESHKGIAELATLSEVLAGTDAERIVTPLTLVETDPARWVEVVKGSPTVQEGDYQVQLAPFAIAFVRTSTNENMSLDASGLNWGLGATNSYLKPVAPTDSRTLLLPDRSGTLAITDQLAGAATDTAAGIVELATAAETQTGTDATRAVTPSALASRTSTDTRTGLIELATAAEVATGTDATRAVTPSTLAARLQSFVRAQDANTKICRGSFVLSANVPAGGGFTQAMTFPSGFFSAAPSVVGTINNGRVTVSINAGSITATGATWRFDNWSPAATGTPPTLDWIAIGVGP